MNIAGSEKVSEARKVFLKRIKALAQRRNVSRWTSPTGFLSVRALTVQITNVSEFYITMQLYLQNRAHISVILLEKRSGHLYAITVPMLLAVDTSGF